MDEHGGISGTAITEDPSEETAGETRDEDEETEYNHHKTGKGEPSANGDTESEDTSGSPDTDEDSSERDSAMAGGHTSEYVGITFYKCDNTEVDGPKPIATEAKD